MLKQSGGKVHGIQLGHQLEVQAHRPKGPHDTGLYTSYHPKDCSNLSIASVMTKGLHKTMLRQVSKMSNICGLTDAYIRNLATLILSRVSQYSVDIVQALEISPRGWKCAIAGTLISTHDLTGHGAGTSRHLIHLLKAALFLAMFTSLFMVAGGAATYTFPAPLRPVRTIPHQW